MSQLNIVLTWESAWVVGISLLGGLVAMALWTAVCRLSPTDAQRAREERKRALAEEENPEVAD